LWLFVALSHYIIIYSRTACRFVYKRRAITGNRSVGGSASETSDEIRIRTPCCRDEGPESVAQPRFRNLSPPRSIFAPPRATAPLVKVFVRDFLRDIDIAKFSPQLARIRKLGRIETDRDGLLDFTQLGLQIAVSPDVFVRGIQAYDAALKGAVERGWVVKTDDGSRVQIMVSSEPLELAVTEKTEPLSEIKVRPGERRPRRPTGALVVSLTAGYQRAMISDRRGTRVESKLHDLFSKAETLACEVHARNERFAEMRRREEIESRRRYEVERRIERLDRNVAAWRRAERIRAYVQVMADRIATEGPIAPESDAAKWLAWARRYADRIDPTSGPITVSPQEFWE
jgi:hypothetical protein